MAKKTKVKAFDDDIVSSQIISRFGNIVESGEKVLEDLKELKVIGISPSLDIALGGGLREGSVVVMTGDPKSGKEQPLSSLVYTPYGPVRMGDIKAGDKVCTPDGGAAIVTAVYPQGVKDVYRVTFNDGSYAECGLDHLWKVSKNKRPNISKWKIVSLRQIIDEGIFYSDRPKWKIPLSKPISFEKRSQYDYPIDPYILGCLIGDGGLTQGSVIITNTDDEILETFKNYAKVLGLELKRTEENGISYRITQGNIGGKENPLTNKLKALNLMGCTSHEKFIPRNYLYSSIEDRFELIRGLMDTDGYNDRGINAEYSTVSKQLAKDVQELIQSLGFTCKIKERITKCNGKEFPSFRLHISGNCVSDLFKISRKKIDRQRVRNDLFKTIKKIELVRKEECQCIMINHPDHLYLTNGFNVTHNTTTALYFAAKCQALGKNVIYLNTEGRITKENFLGIKNLDPSKIKIVQSTDDEPLVSAETYLNVLETYVKNTPDLVVIVDSASNMLPQEELTGEVRTGVRNALPRLLAMFFKRISGDVARNKAILIFITHNIANTGGSKYSPAKMADCGNMLQYQAGTNMVITHCGKWLATGAAASEDEKGPHVGQIANWTIKTSAAGGRPMSTAESWIRYGVGIDEAQEIAQLATEFSMIKKSGAWYEISIAIENKDDPIIKGILAKNNIDLLDNLAIEKFFKFQGIQRVTDFLTENESLKDYIYNQIREIIL